MESATVLFFLFICFAAVLWPRKKDKKEKITSARKNNERQHVTDKKELSCTCEEWVQNRSHYAQDDPMRLCEHLRVWTNIIPSREICPLLSGSY